MYTFINKLLRLITAAGRVSSSTYHNTHATSVKSTQLRSKFRKKCLTIKVTYVASDESFLVSQLELYFVV